MSSTTHATPTQQVTPPVDTRDSAHPQYTPLSNTAEVERMNAGNSFDATNGSWLFGACDAGAATCGTNEGTKTAANPFTRSLAAKRGLGAGTTFGTTYEDRNALGNERVAIGGKLGGALDTAFGADGPGQSTLAMKGHLEGGVEHTGRFVKRADGRYDVHSGWKAQGGGSGGGGANGHVVGAGAEAGASREAHAADVRVVDAETVDRYRMLHNDVMAAYLLVRFHEPTSALDLEVGERSSEGGSIAGKAGGKGSILDVGLEVGGELALGGDIGIARTEAGVVFTATRSFTVGADGKGAVGVKEAHVGASVQTGGHWTLVRTATVTLDPERDRETILRLERTPAVTRFGQLTQLPGCEVQDAEISQADGGYDLAAGPLAYDRDWSGSITTQGDKTTGRYDDVGRVTALGKDVGAERTTNTAIWTGDALELSSTDTVTAPELDLEAKWNGADPMGMVHDLATTVTPTQTVGRTLDGPALDALIALASDTDRWLAATGKAHGEPAAWEGLRTQLVGASREEAGQVLVYYASVGGDLGAVERLCAKQRVGEAVQWPADVPDGAARMTALEAAVAGEPTQADLTALDGLRNAVAASPSFTVAEAKDDLITRLVELRATATAKIAARCPEEAADLAFEQGHATIHAGIQRCSDHKAREAALYAGGLGSDPDRALSELGVFYASWKEAVMALRGAYAQLEIPEESWVVSPRFVAGAEKSVFEPDSVRALALIESNGAVVSPVLVQYLRRIGC
jgi:hypothetical protein